MKPNRAYDLAVALAREHAERRELLAAVARELERLACRREADPSAFLAGA